MDTEGTAGTDSVEDSAPVDSAPAGTTNEIAASVYDTEAEAQDDEVSIESGDANVTQVTEKPTPAEVTEAERILIKAGFKDARRKDNSEFRIPRSKVIDLFNKSLEALKTEHTSKYSAVEKERDSVKADLIEWANSVKGDDRALLEQLASVDPRYQKYLTSAEKKEIAADANDPEPQLILDQGPDAYNKSFAAVRAWDKRQWKREAVAEAQAPFAEREKAEKQREQAEKAQGEIRVKVRGQMDEAQTWPLFGKIADDGKLTEFQQEVFDVFKADPNLSLHSAYMKVAGPRFNADEATVRAKVMKEMQDAPKSTALPRSGEAPRKVKSGSIRDNAAEVYDGASKS